MYLGLMKFWNILLVLLIMRYKKIYNEQIKNEKLLNLFYYDKILKIKIVIFFKFYYN